MWLVTDRTTVERKPRLLRGTDLDRNDKLNILRMQVFCLHASVRLCNWLQVWFPKSPEEGTGSPGTGVTMVESHQGDAGD